MLSPSARLLFLTAGEADADPAIRRLLERRIDWAEFVALAQRENAVAAVWPRLQAIGDGMIPGPVAEHLQRVADVGIFRGLFLRQRLAESAATLGGAGIEVMVLKGAALALALYGGDFAERPMADLDLLVTEERAEESVALLERSGWRLADPADIAGSAYRGHQHLPPLVTAGAGPAVYLEVHTALFFAGAPFALSPAVLHRDARRVAVDGAIVLVPSAPHLLLHACLHFGWSHALRKGAWRAFRDVSALVASGEIDWAAFASLAAEVRGAHGTYWTLRLARRLAAAPVPETVLERLRPDRPPLLLDALERHFASQLVPGRAACPSVRVSEWMWELGMLPERSGHGRVRPWDRDDVFPTREPVGAERRGLGKLAHHATSVVRWMRYCRAVLGPTSTARAGG